MRAAFSVGCAAFLSGLLATAIVMAVIDYCAGDEDVSRFVLYWWQRRVLWPMGVHLDDAAWSKALSQTQAVLKVLPILVFVMGAMVGPLLLRRRMKRVYQQTRDRFGPAYPHCTACWYNLTGNETGVCPECGTPVRRDPNQIFAFPADTNS